MTTPPNFSQMPLDDMLTSRGMSGEQIHDIQSYLRHYGYLQDRFGTLHDGEFDEATEKAVRLYQCCFGLPVSGVMDEATLCEMAKPRCGFVDILPAGSAFSTVSRWEKSNLTYKFNRFSSKLTEAETARDVASAFSLWAEQCDLRFAFAPDSDEVDMDIEFAVGEHGDESPFDGSSGVLAHAYFPPPNGGPLAGDTHFDDDENWTTSLGNNQGIDFLTVAAHEFGHAIGLAHSRQQGALMFPSYSGPQRFLAPDDIAGCQSLYGPPSLPAQTDCR